MRIASLTRQSLVDWPGKVAAVVFTRGCNFRCGFCHNPSLVLPQLMNSEPDIPEKEIFDYLEKRKDWLDGVVITGGEPTVHKDLDIFLQTIGKIGMAIKLDTNGTNPEILESLFHRNLVDFVAMDIKTVLSEKHYARITPNISRVQVEKMIRSVQLIRQSGAGYQFRTTVIPGIHSMEITEQLTSRYRDDPYVFQPFKQSGIDGILSDYIHSTHI
ncbi:MAG: anaerobic ribonucleoside-triphosphate reductase activating protein [Bacteroidales bacterium]|jgi:pyruvate formate lyase activating enzyme|nr:anaerobic ribonucleoside-triphosphate reductase activating protein [Bacteroidales bacterium]